MKLKNKKTAIDVEAIAEENESFGEPKPVITISFKGQSVSLPVNKLAENVETEIGLVDLGRMGVHQSVNLTQLFADLGSPIGANENGGDYYFTLNHFYVTDLVWRASRENDWGDLTGLSGCLTAMARLVENALVDMMESEADDNERG